LYKTWPTARLAHALEREIADYEPEAVVLLKEEFAVRPITSPRGTSVPPMPGAERGGRKDRWWRPIQLDRKQYALRWLIWLGSLVLAIALLEGMGLASVGFVPLVIGALVFKVLGLDLPRLKNAQASPWLLLALLVPLLNLFMQAALFFLPPKRNDA
jgi:hypothetical protein